MVRFLTSEWVEALDEAARARSSESDSRLDGTFSVMQEVTDPEGDGFTYHVVFDRGQMSVREGSIPDATVRFQQDLATAVGIATGSRSAQAAFMSGRLRVGGDLTLLTANGPEFAELADVFGEVRDRTVMPEVTVPDEIGDA